jgi:hypothetical protein
VWLVRDRTTILGPFVADRSDRQLTPESSRTGILFLKRNLPNTWVTPQHLECDVVTDVLAPNAPHDEESGHQSPMLAETPNESKSHWTRLVTKEVHASIGIDEEDGVPIIVVEASGLVGTSEAELREIVDIKLEEVLDDWSRVLGDEFKIDTASAGIHDGHPTNPCGDPRGVKR